MAWTNAESVPETSLSEMLSVIFLAKACSYSHIFFSSFERRSKSSWLETDRPVLQFYGVSSVGCWCFALQACAPVTWLKTMNGTAWRPQVAAAHGRGQYVQGLHTYRAQWSRGETESWRQPHSLHCCAWKLRKWKHLCDSWCKQRIGLRFVLNIADTDQLKNALIGPDTVFEIGSGHP